MITIADHHQPGPLAQKGKNMIFSKTRTAAELRDQAESLRRRAAKAETEAASERSAAAGAFADEREADAQAALARAGQLTAEVGSLRQAADEIDAKAVELEANERLARHEELVDRADKASKAARDQIAKLGARIVKDLRAIQEQAAAAQFASRQAEISAAEFTDGARAPDPFDIPSIFGSGPVSPGSLADKIEQWYMRDE